MNDVPLREVQNEKDIGVIINDQLRFECHMYTKIKKAYNMMRLLWRYVLYMGDDIFMKSCKSLVRPHLEYAQTVWVPKT